MVLPMVSSDTSYDIAVELGNSKQLSLYKFTKYPEIDNVVDHLLKEMVVSYGIDTKKARPSTIANLRYHIQFYVLNLYKAYLRDPDMVVAYSRHTNWYAKWNAKHPKEKQKLSYRYSGDPPPRGKPVLTFLEQNKYIRTWSHMRNPDKHNKSYQPRMRARDNKLINLIEQYGVSKNMVEEDYSSEELIVFKGKKCWKNSDGKLIRKVCEIPDNPLARQMRSNLEKINALMEKSDIRVTITDQDLEAINVKRHNEGKQPIKMPDFSRKRLHRVFHDGSFERHGRYYGAWYEGIYKELRSYITIDGAPTLELDFSSHHAYLCYKLADAEPPSGGLYLLDGYSKDIRKVIKNIFFKMLNSKSKEAAMGAIRAWLNGWAGVGIKKKKEPQIPEELGNLKSGDDLDHLMEMVLTKHAPIRQYFYNPKISGILTNIDSQVTDHILRYFTSMKIPVLPIHDSYIIDARVIFHLQEYMHKVIREGLNINIPISNDNIKGLVRRLALMAEQKILVTPDDPVTIKFITDIMQYGEELEKLHGKMTSSPSRC
jgi:hypothetical protein